ncbi:MAG: TraR/DksA C4-type zinc finger protein [Nitrospiraceae bacterium]|nr:TraR/DksA C4-type zinc finger protein [Nitrospiraceae bacterium]
MPSKKTASGKQPVQKGKAKPAPKAAEKGKGKKAAPARGARPAPVPAAPVQASPVPAPPVFDDRTLALRKELFSRRDEILKEAKREIAKYIKGENRQIVETALDDGDWSVVDLSEDISLKQLSTHRETLRKIDEAIRKLNEGTYGICEECGDEISLERLKVMPFAIYCREDQEKKELLEAMEREEGF